MEVTIADLANALREHRQLSADEKRLFDDLVLIVKVAMAAL